jgi:hypothetical protein
LKRKKAPKPEEKDLKINTIKFRKNNEKNVTNNNEVLSIWYSLILQ